MRGFGNKSASKILGHLHSEEKYGNSVATEINVWARQTQHHQAPRCEREESCGLFFNITPRHDPDIYSVYVFTVYVCLVAQPHKQAPASVGVWMHDVAEFQTAVIIIIIACV